MIDKEICKQNLEILLNLKISNIKYIEDEKAINIGYDVKIVRLDIGGRNKKVIEEYIRNQLQEDIATYQMTLKKYI